MTAEEINKKEQKVVHTEVGGHDTNSWWRIKPCYWFLCSRTQVGFTDQNRWELLTPTFTCIRSRQGWPGTCGLSVSPHAQQRNSLETKSQMEWGWGGSFQPKGFIRAKESPVSSSNWNFGLLLRGLSSIKENKKKRELLSIAKTKVEINIHHKTEPGNWKFPNIALFSWPVVFFYPLIQVSLFSIIPATHRLLNNYLLNGNEVFPWSFSIKKTESNSLPLNFLIVSMPGTYPASHFSNPIPLSHPALKTTQNCAPSETLFLSLFPALLVLPHLVSLSTSYFFPGGSLKQLVHQPLTIDPDPHDCGDRFCDLPLVILHLGYWRYFHNYSYKSSKVMIQICASMHQSFFILLLVLFLG